MSANAKLWYYGTNAIEAQKIVAGDYSAFGMGGGTFYQKVYRTPERAIVKAERAIHDVMDKPVIVEILIKDRSHDSGNRIRIKSARMVSEEELVRRTGRGFDLAEESETSEGVVIRVSHRIYTVQCSDASYQCTLRGKWRGASGALNQVAVGDRVRIEASDDKTGVIRAVLGRKSQYGRSRAKKGAQIIVANLDTLIIVSAATDPPLWPKLVDTYLVLAEASGIQPLVCVNKIDLIEDRAPIIEQLAIYEALGYKTLVTSAVTGEGIEALRSWMQDKISAVAGLSCVGKSALLNAVQPGLQLKTGAYNQKRHEGRHTTAATQLLKLAFGGYVADTAGIRELSLMEMERRVLDVYFPEMNRLRERCDKQPCSHLNETVCAVKAAVAAGEIATTRYKSYRELREG